MTSADRTQARVAGPARAWKTRDIVIAAVIGVVFGVVFAYWNSFYVGLSWVTPPFSDVIYGLWLVPAILAPLVIRKPGAALFAEMAAASISALIFSQWGPDTLLSGFMQGGAAELVFAVVGYRRWSLPVLAIAAVASAVAAWVHDWFLYYAEAAIELQVLRLAVMAVSAIAFAALGSIALARSLDRAGVLPGDSGLGGTAA